MLLRCFAILIAVAVALWSEGPVTGAELAPACGEKRVCRNMTTCAEAIYHLTKCGLSDLDRDGDAIPCETICGKDLATMKARVAAEPYGAPRDLARTPEPLARSELEQSAGGCGSKSTCRQMTSCSEANFYLNSCGVSSLDRNGDGVPCEGLCR